MKNEKQKPKIENDRETISGTFYRIERIRNGGFTEHQLVEVIVVDGIVEDVKRAQSNVLDIVLSNAMKALHEGATKNG